MAADVAPADRSASRQRAGGAVEPDVDLIIGIAQRAGASRGLVEALHLRARMMRAFYNCFLPQGGLLRSAGVGRAGLYGPPVEQ